MIMLNSEMRTAKELTTMPIKSNVYVFNLYWASLKMKSLNKTWMVS